MHLTLHTNILYNQNVKYVFGHNIDLVKLENKSLSCAWTYITLETNQGFVSGRVHLKKWSKQTFKVEKLILKSNQKNHSNVEPNNDLKISFEKNRKKSIPNGTYCCFHLEYWCTP